VEQSVRDLDGTGRVEALVRFLEGVRRGARVLLVARAVLLWVSVAIGALVVGGLLDYFLRAPSGVRAVGLIGAAGVGVWALVRFVWPAVRFGPSLSEIALRVERLDVGRGGEMRGLLASAVELSRVEMADPVGERLRVGVIAEAMDRWRGVRAWGVLRPSFALRAGVLFFGIFVAGGSLVVVEPDLARTGVSRMLMPWAGAQWPRRQVAVDATDGRVHAIDEALGMRAVVVRTNRVPGRTPIRVWYRGVTDSGSGDWRSAFLTGQRQRVVAAGTGSSGGELYERLVDPAEVMAGDTEDGWIEYWFETDDDKTGVSRVRVVRPPEVLAATARVVVPAYAALSVERADLAAGERFELGRGDDERALLGRVLSGSRVEIEIVLNKAVPDPGGASWAREVYERGRDVAVEFAGDQIRVGAVFDGTVRLPVSVTDEFGVSSRDEAVYVIDVIADGAPEPVVREPEHDEQLVSSAVLEVSGDGRDDLGLVRLSLERVIARVPGGSEGAAAEVRDDWEALAIRDFEDSGRGEVSSSLDLGEMGVKAGDEVWLSVVATDSYAAAGLGREGVRSRVRRIRVISESELMEQMQAELGALRQAAMRLDEQQAKLAERVADGEASEQVSAGQRGLTDRIAAQGGTIERLMERQARNGIEDSGLSGMLEDAGGAIAAAATASGEAARAVDQADGAEGEERARAEDEAGESQQRVREELASLIDQLDRGEDGWVARRSIERLLEEQRELTEQTKAAGERMLGRDADALTPQERTELDRIADRQREIAARAAEAIDELGERGKQLADADPAQSAAMAEAQKQGREAEVAEALDEAADDVEANRTSNAQAGQEGAMAALEEMLEELDNAQRQRNAALLRKLSSLIESLDGLIGAQEVAIGRLAEKTPSDLDDSATSPVGNGGGEDRLETGPTGDGEPGLDVEMIRLRGNTLAVSADAGGPDLEVVRGLIDRAAEAQGLAIVALRGEPMDLAVADRREQESLLRLREARAEAARQEEQAKQAEQEQKKRELRQAYREQLEQEVVLREEAGALAGERLSRRERAKARGIGQRQDSVRVALADLLKSTEELRDAAVFAFVHRRLEKVTGRASVRLGRGEVDGVTLRDQEAAIELLRSLVEVLGDSKGNEKDFDEGAGGGGGGGNGGGGEEEPLLPPIAELRLLRAMQAEVVDRARELDDAGEAEPAAVRELGDLQQEIEAEAQGLIDRMEQQGGAEPEVVPEPDGEVQG
jgi:hypothetical protein